MSPLRHALDDYLALRQALGFKLSETRTLLPQFIDFLDQHGHTFITTDWAVRWATQPRPMSSPPNGLGAWAACGALHATIAL